MYGPAWTSEDIDQWENYCNRYLFPSPSPVHECDHLLLCDDPLCARNQGGEGGAPAAPDSQARHPMADYGRAFGAGLPSESDQGN